MTPEQIEIELAAIKDRNKRVEADKAWETSWTRRLLIAVTTYMIMAAIFTIANIQRPLINAIIPTTAFILSSLTLQGAKGLWLGHYKPKQKL